MAKSKSLSAGLKFSIVFLEIFLIAIIVALIITLLTVAASVQLLALLVVLPFIVLSGVFIYYCKKRRAWSFAGASVLGALGVITRIVISTRPVLEVGGGLPIWVTVVYIIIGALVAVTNYKAFMEFRK